MIKEIIKDKEILSKKCVMVKKGELVQQIITDLIDTANEHIDQCIGLAANQIGYDKRIVIIKNKDGKWLPMINPEIVIANGRKFVSKETCMSFEGERLVKRYYVVTVIYQDTKMKLIKLKLNGLQAIIVQHEIDHTHGVLV